VERNGITGPQLFRYAAEPNFGHDQSITAPPRSYTEVEGVNSLAKPKNRNVFFLIYTYTLKSGYLQMNQKCSTNF
jgi:hypothetical protein